MTRKFLFTYNQIDPATGALIAMRNTLITLTGKLDAQAIQDFQNRHPQHVVVITFIMPLEG